MRVFSSEVLAAIQAASGEERVFLVEFDFSSGPLRLSTGSRDLLWNGFTWQAVGGGLEIGGVEESGDLKGQGVDIVLAGVDLSLISTLLSQEYRGRTLDVWQAILDQTLGTVVETIKLFDGLQLDSFQVEERIEHGRPLSATIRTRGQHRLSKAEFRGIRSNVHSHQQYFPGDTFFSHAPSLTDVITFWGPQPIRLGSGGGGSGGDDDSIGDNDNRIMG